MRLLLLLLLLLPQVAPMLGIVGRPLTDAAIAAECFEGIDLPAPPSSLAAAAAGTTGCVNLVKACTPGLLMPEIEALVPSDHARHTHEMRVSVNGLELELACWVRQHWGYMRCTVPR